MAIDFNVSIEKLTEEDVTTEINSIRGDKTSPYWNPGHIESGRYKERMEGLYTRKFPETSERRAELPENKAFHDHLVEEGFETEEQIKAESQEARDRVEYENFERAKTDALSKIRSEFGTESEQVLNYAFYGVDRFLKNSLTEEDWNELNSNMGNDPVFIKKLSDVISYLDSKYWHGKNRSYKREKRGINNG